jgi:hypothetical protein
MARPCFGRIISDLELIKPLCVKQSLWRRVLKAPKRTTSLRSLSFKPWRACWNRITGWLSIDFSIDFPGCAIEIPIHSDQRREDCFRSWKYAVEICICCRVPVICLYMSENNPWLMPDRRLESPHFLGYLYICMFHRATMGFCLSIVKLNQQDAALSLGSMLRFVPGSNRAQRGVLFERSIVPKLWCNSVVGHVLCNSMIRKSGNAVIVMCRGYIHIACTHAHTDALQKLHAHCPSCMYVSH